VSVSASDTGRRVAAYVSSRVNASAGVAADAASPCRCPMQFSFMVITE
jgi:hypothetical protein